MDLTRTTVIDQHLLLLHLLKKLYVFDLLILNPWDNEQFEAVTTVGEIKLLFVVVVVV